MTAVAAPRPSGLPPITDADVRQWEPLVQKIVEKYVWLLPRYLDYEDLIGVGLTALVRAWRTFKRDDKATYKTWAYLIVQSQVQNFLRDCLPAGIRKNTILPEPETLPIMAPSLRDPASDVLREMPCLATPAGQDPGVLAMEAAQRARIDTALAQLKPREREVMTLLYFEQYRPVDAARHMQVTTQYVWLVQKRAKTRLRVLLSDLAETTDVV